MAGGAASGQAAGTATDSSAAGAAAGTSVAPDPGAAAGTAIGPDSAATGDPGAGTTTGPADDASTPPAAGDLAGGPATDAGTTGTDRSVGDTFPGATTGAGQPAGAAPADVTATASAVAAATGPAPAAPTGPATPAAAAPPPTPTFQPPASQLATRIAPLRLEADGIHRLTVNLHPADLGPVQVIAEIRNGEVSVQLSGATDAGNDALRNAIDDLRRELEQSGFANTTVDLRQGSAQQEQARQQFGFLGEARGVPGNGPATAEPAPPAPTAPPTEDGRLDIRA